MVKKKVVESLLNTNSKCKYNEQKPILLKFEKCKDFNKRARKDIKRKINVQDIILDTLEQNGLKSHYAHEQQQMALTNVQIKTSGKKRKSYTKRPWN